jgi:O-antigen ligase
VVFLRTQFGKRMNKAIFENNSLYLIALIIIACSLPLSVFLTSVGIFFLLAVWLFEGRFRKKLILLKGNAMLLVFLTIYMVHVIWLIQSTDFRYGLHDIQMKLPLVVFPVILASMDPLSQKQRKILLSSFMLALFITAIIGLSVLLGFGKKTVTDSREISVFISHIRLSLMINLGIFCGIWMFLNKESTLFRKEKIVYLFLIVALAVFIFILKSITGIVVFLFLVFFSLIWIAIHQKSKNIKYLLIIPIIAIPLIMAGYVYYCFSRFYKTDKIDIKTLESKTASGNTYVHDLQSTYIENGHYVWLYVCEDELRAGWNARSSYIYDGRDRKGQDIKFTLIRYLSSKGLRKDRDGIKALNDEDIRLVESGIANYIYGNKWKLYPYVYRIIWEIDSYEKGENPAGHSVAQRLLYLSIAKEIIQNHFWFGVGTGDVQKEFNKIYESKHRNIPFHWRRRAHNQFLTFWISFGIIGLTLIILAFFLPVFARIKLLAYPGYIFILIACLSMVNEDTLETHPGSTFIALFYSLFFIMRSNEMKNESN